MAIQNRLDHVKHSLSSALSGSLADLDAKNAYYASIFKIGRAHV